MLTVPSFPQALQPEGSFLALPLHIDLFSTAKGLQKVTLSHSKSFSYQFHGNHWENQILDWLHSYNRKKPLEREFHLDDSGLTSFQKEILKKLDLISFGTVCSYADVAGVKYARAVGNACGKNPWPLFIGCHRIIASSGDLGGFGFGKKLKQLLLDFEEINAS